MFCGKVRRWGNKRDKRISIAVENRLVTKGEEGEGGIGWEFGVSRCKLLYIKWINNKVLVYSTGDNIQHPVINFRK